MPQISVIIPVYNVENYVEKCLRSILEQTFTDIEVICVDNGSSDNSLKVLENLAAEDSRVRIFSMANQGPGACRNKGLDEAKGEAAPSSAGLELAHKDTLDRDKGDSVEEFAKFAFACSFVWGRLYRREIIENNKIRFPSGIVEDVPFIVMCFVQARRVKRIPDLLYYYRVGRPGSISGKAERMLLDGIKNFGMLEDNLREYGVFEEVKETFWFNKMNLLIGDERIFAGRLGNVPQGTVQKAYDLIRKDVLELPADLFARRNAWFRWKVRGLQRALTKNDLKFPRRLRKLRNIAMIFLNPYYKLKGKFSTSRH